MKLALGTVQFGLGYGVAGRATAVPPDEVRVILARATELGIDMLDTAAAYGDIEAHLPALLTGLPSMRIVTKLPPKPADLSRDGLSWLDGALASVDQRLGDALHGLMFHRGEDLLDGEGERLWSHCASWAAARGCKLGVSVYDPATLDRLLARFPITIAQLPGNAFDQRLQSAPRDVEIHLRSTFLQGLLLMPGADAAARVPAAAAALAKWQSWLHTNELTPLTGALSIVKSMPGIARCVVGVDSLDQLEAIARAWVQASPRRADTLAQSDLDVIDPRCWPPRPR